MLTLWPNWWDDWVLEHKVSFSGTEKIIYLHPDEEIIDVKADIYSAWKEWSILRDNTKFLEAIRVVGGDPITNIISLGATFFLINGWKIRPTESDYTLTINGNLYSDDGSSPLIKTLGDYNILISMTRSNLIDTVLVGGSTGPTVKQIVDGVLDETLADHSTTGSVAAAISKTKKNAGLIPAMV